MVAHQQEKGWGARIIDRLSADLRQRCPEARGYSPRNLEYMRASAAWPDPTIVVLEGLVNEIAVARSGKRGDPPGNVTLVIATTYRICAPRLQHADRGGRVDDRDHHGTAGGIHRQPAEHRGPGG